jgi:hypothetical protein
VEDVVPYLVLFAIAFASSRAEPFVPVGVMYSASATATRQHTLRDLQSIRADGFNAIGTRVNWTDAPRRVELDAFETLLDLAADADLKVVTQIDTSAVCPDRPDIRAAMVTLVEAVTARAARHSAFYALDVTSSPRPMSCRLSANDSYATLLADATSARDVRSVITDQWWFENSTESAVVRLNAWAAVSHGARGFMFATRTEAGAAFARVVTRNTALFAPLRLRRGLTPDVRIDGGSGDVDATFLESADVLVLIGLNHGATPARVTMSFTPDTQEAIWQNMETGATVNFVGGANGPTYTHTFAAYETMVLMIRTSIR